MLPYEPHGVRLKGHYNLAPPAPNVKEILETLCHLPSQAYTL